MNKQKICVLFSGGLDSTLALMKVLDYAKCGIPVVALSILFENNQVQGKREGVSRRKIAEILGTSYDLEYRTIRLSFGVPHHAGGTVAATQAMQMPLALGLSIQHPGEFQTIVSGYASSDCFWKFSTHWESAIRSTLQMVATQDPLIEPIQDDLIFSHPLKLHSKQNIVDELHTVSPNLLKAITWCENIDEISRDGTWENCGGCLSCAAMEGVINPSNGSS